MHSNPFQSQASVPDLSSNGAAAIEEGGEARARGRLIVGDQDLFIFEVGQLTPDRRKKFFARRRLQNVLGSAQSETAVGRAVSADDENGESAKLLVAAKCDQQVPT